jgi:hypothetical protein
MTKPDKTDYEVPEMQENYVRMAKCNELKRGGGNVTYSPPKKTEYDADL